MGATSLLIFPLLLTFLFLGFPVAFSMLAAGAVFGYATFGDAFVFQAMEKIEDVASNFVLAAVPLFVFMGSMLERSGIADKLFEAIHLWTRRLPGGLAIGTILMCIVFAASSGVVGATETVIGLLAIPVMMRYRYNKELIVGTICAGGSLGTIIPPSVVAVVMGPLAQVSVGDLLVGMIFPGLIMAGSYILYTLILCTVKPEHGPRIPPTADDPPLAEKLRVTGVALVPPMFLIFAVLGSIMLGWAAPTEAAALGAAGSVLLTLFYRTFTLRTLHEAIMKTLAVSTMIMAILLGGSIMTGAFVGSGGIAVTQQLVNSMNLGPWGVLCIVLLLAFIAGFFIDWISIVLILVPIFAPLLKSQGVDMAWFCISLLIVIQTSYLSPPMAPAIFYFRAISPPEITTAHMYRGVIPFIVLQLITLAMVLVFPATVLWLPKMLLTPG
ncbi:MAG: TRAP transporter large permease subunit [Alphaproteobacteria bacterium]|nr:TRAP transporter large permease subunit [Alphaproteobacteria bacterium]